MYEVLFRLRLFGDEIPFYSYGFLFGLGCYCAAMLAAFLAEKDGIPTAKVVRFAVGVILCGLVGGRLHAMATDPTLANAGWFDRRGFTYYGASLSGVFGGIPICIFLLKIPTWAMLDAAACGLALAHTFGRLGCFLAGCCYGARAPEGHWLAVHYPAGSICWQDEVTAGLIGRNASCSLAVWPTQLIEMGLEAVMTAAMSWLLLKRPRRQGTVLFTYFMLYGLIRIGTETIRGDDLSRGLLFGRSTSTTIGIVTTSLCAALIFVPWLAALRPARSPEPVPVPTT